MESSASGSNPNFGCSRGGPVLRINSDGGRVVQDLRRLRDCSRHSPAARLVTRGRQNAHGSSNCSWSGMSQASFPVRHLGMAKPPFNPQDRLLTLILIDALTGAASCSGFTVGVGRIVHRPRICHE